MPFASPVPPVAPPVKGTAEEKAEDRKPETTPQGAPDVLAPEAGSTPEQENEAAAPSEPPQRKRRALLWVLLLLLLGGGVGAWLILGRSGIVPLPRKNLYGPPFAPMTYWLVIGPFPAKDGRDLGQTHPPERAGHGLTATFKGPQKALKWKPVKVRGSTVSFDRELGEHTHCNGYGLTYIECPVETKVRLGIGSDDGVRVWLNGKEVHKNPTLRSCVPDQDRVAVTLKKGVNEIFIKVAQGTGQWGFAATIRNPKGKPLSGLRGRLPKQVKIPGADKPKKPTKKPLKKN